MSNPKPSLLTLKKAADLTGFIESGRVGTVTPPQSGAPTILGVSPMPAAASAPKLDAPAPAARTKPAAAAKSEAKKKTSFSLDPNLHRQLKILAVQKGRNLEDLLTDAIKGYLKRNEAST